MSSRLRIAIQKGGRLSEKSLKLLNQAGLDFDNRKERLFYSCQNFPLDIMFLRDDDIPEYVSDGICDLGIVGVNVLEEKKLGRITHSPLQIKKLKNLGFAKCHLAIALPEKDQFDGPGSLSKKRIATSYPHLLKKYLSDNNVEAEIVEISGSVEIAPTLKIADAICDLVSTGGTLRSNQLKEVQKVLESESCLIQTETKLSEEKATDIQRLLDRISGVMLAAETKYIMLNAPLDAVDKIKSLIPGMEEPTIIPLASDASKVAVHAVARENVFWETIENLKLAGASSILVLPIEKIIS